MERSTPWKRDPTLESGHLLVWIGNQAGYKLQKQ